MPDGWREPLHAPDAVQDVALVDVQVSVELPPLVTEVGLPVNVSVGAGVGVPFTVTVTLRTGLLPPAPEHWIEKVVLVVRLLIA